LLLHARVLCRLYHVDLEPGPSLRITLGRNDQNQSAIEFHFHVPNVRPYRHLLDRLTLESRHRQHDAPEILQVGGTHTKDSARSWTIAASGIRSAWMNSDDFEVASNGYGVQSGRISATLGDRVYMPNLVPMRDYSP